MNSFFRLFLVFFTLAIASTAWGFEYVIVNYPEARTVVLDGTIAGNTNIVLMVERGTYTFSLGGAADYSPASQIISVFGTTVSSPMSITFTQNPPPGGDGGGGGFDPGGGGGGYNEDIPCFPGIDPNCPTSPIVINFENGGYRLTGANAPVSFDMLG